MIRFDQEDSDPYTYILIYEDDEFKSGSLGAFSLHQFESWLNKQVFPQSVKEAEALLGEYDALNKKSADAGVQRIMAGINKEEAGSYDQRYARLKSRGVSEHEIHTKLFPEEYDFIYDDHVDATLRRQGVNPMSQDYTERTNARRVAGGFSPFGSDGGDQQSMAWCSKQKTKWHNQKCLELKDPEQPDVLLSPEKAAIEYKNRTGNCLNLSRLVRLDLDGSEGYAAKKLAQAGVLYEKSYPQGSWLPGFKFSDSDGSLIFFTQEQKRAMAFVEALKMVDD